MRSIDVVCSCEVQSTAIIPNRRDCVLSHSLGFGRPRSGVCNAMLLRLRTISPTTTNHHHHYYFYYYDNNNNNYYYYYYDYDY